jgi:hypothetical protein
MGKNAIKRQQRRNMPRTSRAIAPVVPETCEWKRKKVPAIQKTVKRYKPDTYEGIEYAERFAVPSTAVEPKKPSIIDVTVFMPSTVKYERKSAYRDTPRVKG